MNRFFNQRPFRSQRSSFAPGAALRPGGRLQERVKMLRNQQLQLVRSGVQRSLANLDWRRAQLKAFERQVTDELEEIPDESSTPYDTTTTTSGTTVTPTPTVPPLPPTVTTPPPGQVTIVNLGNYSITGTSQANTIVRIWSATGGVKIPGLNPVGTEMLSGPATTYSINVPLTPNSMNQFVVTATDAAGNESQGVVVQITQGPPIIAPTVTDPAAVVSVNEGSYTIRGTAPANSYVQVWQGSNGNKVGDPLGAYILSGSATTYQITVRLAANTVNQFVITAKDTAGNESAVVRVPDIAQGTTIAAPIVTDPTAAVTVTDTSYVIRGTAPANSYVQVWKGSNGSKVGSPLGAAILDPSTTTYEITVRLTANSTNQFVATARDATGNESAVVRVPEITQGDVVATGGTPTAPANPPGVPTNLEEIEGISEVNARKLRAAGISNIEVLLDKGGTPQGRKEISDNTGLSEKVVLKWVNYADLFRINGVAGQNAELLEGAGVDTVLELAQRNPENLQKRLVEVNNEKQLVKRPPSLSQVSKWVQEAGTLPRKVQY